MEQPKNMTMSLPAFMGVLYLLVVVLCYLDVRTQGTVRIDPLPSSLVQLKVSGTSGSLFTAERVRVLPDGLRIDFADVKANSSVFPQSACRSNKWAVVTTIFELSDALRSVISMGDWCCLIVADRKTPATLQHEGSKYPNVEVLTVSHQEALQSILFVEQIPWNHFGRKNIGYLYAIRNGAEQIWDFDDDNYLLRGIPAFLPNNSLLTYLPYSHSYAVNLYPTMGSSYLPSWPRGFPLLGINNDGSLPFFSLPVRIRSASVGVIQSLADHDPDVDAIYRMTSRLPFQFSGQRVFLLPKSKFMPFNAQATLFFRNSFWMLFLPISVHGRVSDIWRSYLGTKLNEWTASEILFSPPLVRQDRNPHNYLADFSSELDLYIKTDALLTWLQSWRPPSDDFMLAIRELWIEAYERDFVALSDVVLVQQWLKELILTGYKFPDRLNQSASSHGPHDCVSRNKLMPQFPYKNGSDGDITCNCNFGNFNNQLIVCKQCFLMAYALNRRVLFMPFCMQGNSNTCTAFDSMFDLEKISLLLPASSLKMTSPEASACREPSTDLLDNYDHSSVTLEDISANPVHQGRSKLCYQPPWIVSVVDKCASSWGFGPLGMQRAYMAMQALFRPAANVQSQILDQLAKFDGPFLAVHLRRPQEFVKYDEMKAWTKKGYPATDLPIEEIIPMIEYLLTVYKDASRRVYLATNSNDAAEIKRLEERFTLHRYQGGDDIAHMAIEVDIFVAAQGVAFLGTPGSTFTETIRQEHFLQRGHINDVLTFCSVTNSSTNRSLASATVHDCSL